MPGRMLFGLALALIALSCGPSPRTAPSASEEPVPKAGGALLMREVAEVAELDPTMAEQSGLKFVSPRAFDSLLDVESGPNVGWNEWVLMPKLAERWEVSPDARQYTFHLRKGVKFANLPPVNGRELTAADVKWSLEYIGRLGQFKDVVFQFNNQLQPKVGPLERVEAPDSSTVIAHMSEPFAPFLNYTALPHLTIMPREVYDQDGRFSEHPIGSGPWQWDQDASQTGTRIVYKKNPDYWQAGKPYLDEVRSLIIRDQNAAYAAFQTRQLDVLNDVPLSDAEALKQSVPDAPVIAAMGSHGYRVYYNVKVPPLNDVRFRQAMSLATDREEFVRTFTKGEGQWGVDGAPPGIFPEDEARKMSPYDPEAAKRLLREAGYLEKPVTIEWLYTTTAGQQVLASVELLQSQWAKVGIDLKILSLERVDVSRRQRSGNFMMLANGPSAGEPEPDFYFYGYFHSKSPGNNYEVNDPRLDQLADAQRRETDPAKRLEAWRQEARYIHDNGLALWIYYAPGYYFKQPHVKGYYPSNPNNQKPTVETWLDK